MLPFQLHDTFNAFLSNTLPRFLLLVKYIFFSQNSVIGHFLYEEVVKRLPEEKWFLTLAEYPNATYPPFAVGQLYVFPQTSLSAVLEAARHIPVHWLDDVYIGGQIPAYLKMTLMHVHERAHLWEVDSLKCYGDKYYIIHATPAERKREIYYDRCMERYRKEVRSNAFHSKFLPIIFIFITATRIVMHFPAHRLNNVASPLFSAFFTLAQKTRAFKFEFE